MACARNIPQAYADLKAGRWEKGKWGKGGVELRGKTLGIIGLGRIGFLVAEDARGLGMKVLAYDPFVPGRAFRELGAGARRQRRRDLPARPTSSPCTCPRTPTPSASSATRSSRKMKDGVRVVNVARGGIIDEEAWARAIESGKVAASARRRVPHGAHDDEPALRLRQCRVHAAPGRLHGRGAAARRHDHRRAGGGRAQAASSPPTPSTRPPATARAPASRGATSTAGGRGAHSRRARLSLRRGAQARARSLRPRARLT